MFFPIVPHFITRIFRNPNQNLFFLEFVFSRLGTSTGTKPKKPLKIFFKAPHFHRQKPVPSSAFPPGPSKETITNIKKTKSPSTYSLNCPGSGTTAHQSTANRGSQPAQHPFPTYPETTQVITINITDPPHIRSRSIIQRNENFKFILNT
jgi:hypothetical protein